MAAEATLAIGMVTSILTTLPKEGLKHYINRYLTRDERLKQLSGALDVEIEEVKATLKGMDQVGPAGHAYLCSDWVDNVEQLRYDLEDFQDSEEASVAADSLQASSEHFKKMHKGLKDGVGGYRATTVGEGSTSATIASLYQLPTSGSIRKEPMRKIGEELMTTRDQSDSSLGVCIIGICGLGKIALAKAVANEASIKAHFSCIITPPAYAPDFNMDSILDHFRAAHDKTSKDERKRVLVVLDGVPAPGPGKWTQFKTLLDQSGPGSKFLITTRNPRTADVTGTSEHFLEPLTEKECLSLIEIQAEGNAALPADDRRALDHNWEDLARKCRGLPLLANHIGLCLSAARGGSRLTTIQELTSPPEALAGLELVLAILNPALAAQPHLKRCMSYCSLFPHDYAFKEDSMVHLWMAEGFTSLSRTEANVRTLREAATQNFEDLHSYSIFRTSNGQEPSYEMHEAAYDLAQHVSSKLCCRAHIDEGTSSISISSKVRHFSLSCEYGRDVENDVVQELLGHIKKECFGLRTFLLLHEAGKKVSKNPTFFQNLTHLRVLDLSHTCLADLKNISKLKCLRYLDLSHTPIKKLPKLSNSPLLQVLKLKGCNKLDDLPLDFSNLTSLISLQVNWKKCLLLPSIGKLSNLRELNKFTVGTKKRYKIGELANLNDLRGSLHIRNLKMLRIKQRLKGAICTTRGG